MKPNISIASLCALCVLCGSVPPSSAADPPKVTYADHLLPALRDKCLACHNADKSRGGLDMSSYVKLMEGGSSGVVVKRGEPDDSRLFTLAAHKAEPKMPPEGAPIPAEALATLRKWIEQGALETAASKAPLMNKPKSEIALVTITKGRPAGPPPMPATVLPPAAKATPRPAAVTALASSPWAPLLAVAGSKQVLLVHADTLVPLGALPFVHGQINVLKFSRNGQLLLAAGGRGGKLGKATVWNVVTGKLLVEVGEEHDAVLAADISADQTQIAMGGPGKIIRVYATKDGSLIREIKKHTDWVTAIEFSPDGVLLASGDRSSGLFVWEAHSGQEYFGLRGHSQCITDVSWRDDGNVLASCSEDGRVRLWEMENGRQIKAWGAHAAGAESLRFGHDGLLTTCGRDRVAKLWDQNGTQKREFEALGDVALRVAMSHDGSRIIAGDLGGSLRSWSAADGKRFGDFTTNPIDVSERLAVVQKDLVTREAELVKATANLTAAKTASEKANKELPAFQKAAADSANIAAVVADALAQSKPPAEAANAALSAARQVASAREVKSKAFAEAVAKIQDAAGKDANNAELKQGLQAAQQIAVSAASDFALAQKALEAATAQAKVRNDKLAAAQKAVADMSGPTKAAADLLAAKTAETKKAGESFVAAQATVASLSSEIAMLKSALTQLKSAAVAKRN